MISKTKIKKKERNVFACKSVKQNINNNSTKLITIKFFKRIIIYHFCCNYCSTFIEIIHIILFNLVTLTVITAVDLFQASSSSSSSFCIFICNNT
jgi:hypothetical protein